jgi:hypothetical protein
MTVDQQNDSLSWKVFREAIDSAIAEESPYPEASAFIDDDTPHTDRQIQEALKRGYAAVVVSADGEVRVIHAPNPRQLDPLPAS